MSDYGLRVNDIGGVVVQGMFALTFRGDGSEVKVLLSDYDAQALENWLQCQRIARFIVNRQLHPIVNKRAHPKRKSAEVRKGKSARG